MSSETAVPPLKIFINYHREDEPGRVGRLRDSLNRLFGPENVFYDLTSIAGGEDFAAKIESTIDQADIVLVIIGPRWTRLSLFRRLLRKRDWVEFEIEHARRHRKPILPVVMNGAAVPAARWLAQSLMFLSRIQAMTLRDESWDADFSDLLKRIPIVAHLPVPPLPAPPPASSGGQAERTSKRLRRPHLGIAVALAAGLALSAFAYWHWPTPKPAHEVLREGPSVTAPPKLPDPGKAPLLLPSKYQPAAGRPLTIDMYAKGLDVSHHAGQIDWQAVAKAGYSFVFLKATQGTDLHDGTFEAYRSAARAAGLICGAYHFYKASEPPAAQADYFLTHATFAPGDLPAVLDLESDPFGGTISESNLVFNMGQWLYQVERATGRPPIVYAPKSFAAQHYGTLTALSPYPLWIAQYNSQPIAVPTAWTTWTFWQARDSERVPGVSVRTDLNYFNGSVDDLRAFAGLPAK